MANELPLPPHWDPDRVGEVWRVDYAERFADAERWREQHGVCDRGRRPVPRRPRRRRRPEHLLHARLRALRRRPHRHRRARRLAPALRVRLPQPRLADPDRVDARHASGAPDLPSRPARGPGREASRAVHPGDGRGRRHRPLADQPGCGGGPRARPRLRGRASALLHADPRGGREVQPHRLALPRDAGRDRLRARAGHRGGALLPLDRPLRAARLPAEGRQPAHGALLDARPRGRVRSARESRSASATSRWSSACSSTTPC